MAEEKSSRSVLLLLAPHFEEIEALGTVDLLRRAGVQVTTFSPTPELLVEGAHRVRVQADSVLMEVLPQEVEKYDGLILPGGPGIFSLRNSKFLCQLIKYFDENRKLLAAICAAPVLLKDAGVLRNRAHVAHPCIWKEMSQVTRNERLMADENLITADGPGSTFLFAFAILRHLLSPELVNELERSW